MKRWSIIALISMVIICIVLLTALISLGAKLDKEMALRFETEDTLAELRDENASLQDKLKALGSELDRNRVKVNALEENLSKEQSSSASLKSEIERLNALNFELNTKNSELASKIESLNQQKSPQTDVTPALSSAATEQAAIQEQ